MALLLRKSVQRDNQSRCINVSLGSFVWLEDTWTEILLSHWEFDQCNSDTGRSSASEYPSKIALPATQLGCIQTRNGLVYECQARKRDDQSTARGERLMEYRQQHINVRESSIATSQLYVPSLSRGNKEDIPVWLAAVVANLSLSVFIR
jgi:hypothetical protein